MPPELIAALAGGGALLISISGAALLARRQPDYYTTPATSGNGLDATSVARRRAHRHPGLPATAGINQ
jgi:hypothetical protein